MSRGYEKDTYQTRNQVLRHDVILKASSLETHIAQRTAIEFTGQIQGVTFAFMGFQLTLLFKAFKAKETLERPHVTT